jgi:hypothetical protein
MMHERQISEGAPEDLVLNGVIEAGLLETESTETDPPGMKAGGKIVFDRETGNLSLKHEPGTTVNLVSEDPEIEYWTKRALERTGFRVECNKKGSLLVLIKGEANSTRWIVEKSGRKVEFDSLYGLSLYLRKMS